MRKLGGERGYLDGDGIIHFIFVFGFSFKIKIIDIKIDTKL